MDFGEYFEIIFSVVTIFIAVLYSLNISRISDYQTGKLPEFTTPDDKFRVKSTILYLGMM